MNPFKLRLQADVPEEAQSIQGERELSPVNKHASLRSKVVNWAFILSAGALALIFLFKYYSHVFEQHRQTKAQVKDASHAAGTTTLPPLALPDPEPEPARSPAAAGPADPLPPLPQPAAGVSTSNTIQAPKAPAQLWRERRLKSSVRFNWDGHGSAAAMSPTAALAVADPGVATAASAGELAPQPASTGALAGRSTPFTAPRAYRLPEPSLVMTRGKVIPCTVMPAIDTTLTGIVTCVMAEDATGSDNKVTLMERGTLCTGTQGGGVMRGQQRVGIIWQRCETPQHVLVPLDAGAADALGRPGIPGAVDDHFWDRFSAAIALSLVTEIGPYLAASRQGGNNTTIAFPIVSGPQEIMAEVLKHTVDVPATITAPQGARVLIYLAGDIDFRDVYQLERKR